MAQRLTSATFGRGQPLELADLAIDPRHSLPRYSRRRLGWRSIRDRNGYFSRRIRLTVALTLPSEAVNSARVRTAGCSPPASSKDGIPAGVTFCQLSLVVAFDRDRERLGRREAREGVMRSACGRPTPPPDYELTCVARWPRRSSQSLHRAPPRPGLTGSQV